MRMWNIFRSNCKHVSCGCLVILNSLMFPTQLHPSLQQPCPHEYYSSSQQPLGFSELFTRFHLFCELLIDSRSRLKMYKAVGEELVLRRNESEFVHKWRYSAHAQLLVVLWVTNHYKPHFKSISDESHVLNLETTMILYWIYQNSTTQWGSCSIALTSQSPVMSGCGQP